MYHQKDGKMLLLKLARQKCNRFNMLDDGNRTSKKISASHFAFLRAVIQGIDEERAWVLYLSHYEEFDRRRATALINRMRDELAIMAKHLGRHSVSRLMLLRIDDRANKSVPSLEEFASSYPDGFYSQTELVEMWTHEYGRASRIQKRRQGIVSRQMEAIHWLETQTLKKPSKDDSVDAWLDSAISSKLSRAGIRALTDLCAIMNGRGHRWWRDVPGIGASAAGRILAFIDANLDPGTIDPHVYKTASDARSKLELVSSIAPLERFTPPNKFVLDYTHIGEWLHGFKSASNTFRGYRNALERLLLWSVFENGNPITTLSQKDYDDFAEFLANPSPDWLRKRGVERWQKAWRPLNGRLQPSSIAKALAAIRSYATWFNQKHERQCVVVPRLQGAAFRRSSEHIKAPFNSIAAFIAWLNKQREDVRTLRMKAIVALLINTPFKLSVLARSNLSQCLIENISNETYISVAADGHVAKVHANDLLPLLRYVGSRGLSFGSDASLIANLKGLVGMSQMALYREVKLFLTMAAPYFGGEDLCLQRITPEDIWHSSRNGRPGRLD